MLNCRDSRRVSVLSKAKMEFGVIPKEHWYQPDWIDEEKATKERNRMAALNVKYGGASNHRPLHLCCNNHCMRLSGSVAYVWPS